MGGYIHYLLLLHIGNGVSGLLHCILKQWKILGYGEEHFYSWDRDFLGFRCSTREGRAAIFAGIPLYRGIPAVLPISVPIIYLFYFPHLDCWADEMYSV
jgi:hypothetical protein